jgi:hypothetical protein
VNVLAFQAIAIAIAIAARYDGVGPQPMESPHV